MSPGRFEDKGETEDFSNVITQSLAIIALKGCEARDCPGSPNLKSGIEPGGKYLRGQQCETASVSLNGAFRSTIGLKPTECNANPPFTETEPENQNAVEVDSTGAAVQALLAEGSTAAKTSATNALNWLKKTVNTRWSAGEAPVENYCSETEFTKLLQSVNSTALAIMAYIEAGNRSKNRKWLKGSVEKQPKGENGLPACTASGKPNVLATAQGILGLEGVATRVWSACSQSCCEGAGTALRSPVVFCAARECGEPGVIPGLTRSGVGDERIAGPLSQMAWEGDPEG